MAVVLIIAIVLLLIGNYAKNYKSGVSLSYQRIGLDLQNTPADIDNDLVLVANSNTELKKFAPEAIGETVSDNTFDNNILLGITTASTSTSYNIKIDKIYLRGTQVNINYRIYPPYKAGVVVQMAIHNPNILVKLEKTNLPTNVPVEFRFNNLSDLRTETINKIIK